MSTLLLEPPQTIEDLFDHEARRGLGGALITRRTGAHGRLTLDELVTSVWEGLAVRDVACCPICADTMVRDADAPVSATGVCRGCGSRLD